MRKGSRATHCRRRRRRRLQWLAVVASTAWSGSPPPPPPPPSPGVARRRRPHRLESPLRLKSSAPPSQVEDLNDHSRLEKKRGLEAIRQLMGNCRIPYRRTRIAVSVSPYRCNVGQRFSHARGTAILSLRGHHARSELYESIDKVDFPRSVLTWHLITDICFFLTGGDAGLANRHMRLCREVSNYLMDLVMVRRVMTSSEGHVAHLKAREEVKLILEHHSDKKVKVDDVEAVRKMLEAGVSRVADSAATSSGYVQFAVNSTDTMRPVLPRAWTLAQTLLHPAGRSSGGAQWELIASVLMEMLFHLAPRCEARFHAKNLSAGGEYITHVRFLLHNRGFGWNFVLART